MLEKRFDYFSISPKATKLLIEMEKYIAQTNIDVELRELIKIRASQINGCAYCLNMHTKEARSIGMVDQRIDCVAAFRDGEMYTEKEKVALELTEHVTLVASKHVPDELYNRVREHFDERDFVDLIFIINQINSWNRLSIATGNFAARDN